VVSNSHEKPEVFLRVLGGGVKEGSNNKDHRNKGQNETRTGTDQKNSAPATHRIWGTQQKKGHAESLTQVITESDTSKGKKTGRTKSSSSGGRGPGGDT